MYLQGAGMRGALLRFLWYNEHCDGCACARRHNANVHIELIGDMLQEILCLGHMRVVKMRMKK